MGSLICETGASTCPMGGVNLTSHMKHLVSLGCRTGWGWGEESACIKTSLFTQPIGHESPVKLSHIRLHFSDIESEPRAGPGVGTGLELHSESSGTKTEIRWPMPLLQKKIMKT